MQMILRRNPETLEWEIGHWIEDDFGEQYFVIVEKYMDFEVAYERCQNMNDGNREEVKDLTKRYDFNMKVSRGRLK